MKRVVLLLLLVAVCAEAHKPITSKYTYTEDVFPILKARCGACHLPGGVAPMSLLTYKDAFPWAESIRVELLASHMPPWYAEPGYGFVKEAHRLTTREFDILMTWVTGGTPQGPSRQLPSIGISNRWKTGPPDLILPMAAAFTLDADTMEATKEFVLQAGGAKDRWVKAVDLLPGAPAIVRNATILTRANGESSVLGTWLPGEDLAMAPAGTAFRWPAGSDLILRIHYVKTWTYDGKVISDRSQVGLFLAKGTAQGIRTVAGVDRNVQALALRVEGGTADKEMKIEAVRPDGAHVPLLEALYRPNWSRRFWFSQPIALPRGTRINVIGTSKPTVLLDVIDK
jgi:hypothetical protein